MIRDRKLPIIGSTEYVEISEIKNVPAKIDTGADTSSVWASNIEMQEDGTLVFCLFNKKSDFYTGERLTTTDYKARVVRSSHGDEQIRYRVKLPLRIGGELLETTFTLANRSRNNFPILIGRHTLEGRFLVDVSINNVSHKRNPETKQLNEELKENPYKFHQKYIEN